MRFLNQGSTIIGLVGVLLCTAAVLFRLNGSYYIAGFESLTLFNGGIAVMVFACFTKLEGIQRSLVNE